MVVSGGAEGIDTMCLTGALSANRPVIAVLGGGVDVVYPASNRTLFEDIAFHGCLISEYPPQTPALGSHFPVRNRIYQRAFPRRCGRGSAEALGRTDYGKPRVRAGKRRLYRAR